MYPFLIPSTEVLGYCRSSRFARLYSYFCAKRMGSVSKRTRHASCFLSLCPLLSAHCPPPSAYSPPASGAFGSA